MQVVAGVIEEDEMVRQEPRELVDDRHAARLAGLCWDELLAPAIPAPVNVNPAAVEIDSGNVEGQQLPET